MNTLLTSLDEQATCKPAFGRLRDELVAISTSLISSLMSQSSLSINHLGDFYQLISSTEEFDFETKVMTTEILIKINGDVFKHCSISRTAVTSSYITFKKVI